MTTRQKAITQRLGRSPSAKSVRIEIDGEQLSAYEGETIAAILMLGGHRTLTPSSPTNLARTVYCGMGLCHQCLVTVDGVRDVRACMTEVRPGMQITSQLPAERSSQ